MSPMTNRLDAARVSVDSWYPFLVSILVSLLVSIGIEERWPKIAQGLFTYPDTPGDVCAAVGICKKKDIFRAGVSCDICKAGLVLVTDVLANNDDFANMVVENVKDPIYCSGEADVQACNDFVDKYGVKAIKALGAALPGEIDRICSPPQCE